MAKKSEEEQVIQIFLDRIEDETAVIVLSDVPEIHFNLPLQFLPSNVEEGDHLKLTLKLDPESTEAARHRVAALQAELSPEPETNIKL
ncbi:MAG TPA: DUF3006 domain-containing protein [Blastocatellia bacterium]|nr:DUF3006 domain-containing protein [Blastocatellia bacterium]